MIVQVRREGLRLIRQHDHALAAGELAHAWRTASGVLPFRLVTAVGLHDLAWRELDREPGYDPETGRPLAFDSYPLGPKLRAYGAGIDEMEAVDPWIGLLGSLHYSSFLDDEAAPRFLASERKRQDRLRKRLAGRSGAEDPGIGREVAREGEAIPPDAGRGPPASPERHLRWLKFFDGLSLRICLSPPAVPDAGLPSWLHRRGVLSSPGGDRIAPRWQGDDRVELGSAPLAGPVTLEIPVRDLPERSYPDADALERAWRESRPRTWRLRVVPAPSGRA